MQSFATVPQSAKHTSSPQHREAAPRSLLHAPQRLNRAPCACGGTCPQCRGETRAATNLQPKLTVNEPGDAFEQEADRVADQVMRMSAPAAPAGLDLPPQAASSAQLQRRLPALQCKCACGGSTDFSGGADGNATAPPIVHEALRSPGQPLDTATRAFMEPRFGANLAEVRIHVDETAAKSAQAVQARAFTVGRDIVFGMGQYVPEISSGRRLLAHELAHVMQQSNSRTAMRPTSLAISKPDDANERDADQIADVVVGSRAIASLQTERGKSGVSGMLQRTIGDGHDLQSPRFADDPVLESCFDNERLLRFGSRGPAVEKIQGALVDAGFPLPVFGVDGIFESETQTAVRNYQRAHGLDANGIVGPITMGSLDGLFAAPGPAPAPPGPAPAPPGPAPTPPGPAPTSPGPAPAPPGPAPTPPGPAPAPPGPAPTPPGPAPTPPGPAPTPPGPAPAPPGPAPTPSEAINSFTVAVLPAPRTRTTIGVGEEVALAHKPGSAAWTTTAGTLSAANGTIVILTAPDTAQTVTVTAGAATLAFDVIAPTDVHMDPLGTAIRHTVNHADLGIATQPFLLPDTVNFLNVIYHEMNVGAVVTDPGAFSCLAGRVHCRNVALGAACADIRLTDTVTAGKGTQAAGFDCAYSGDCQQTAPFTPGSITFAIPYEYKVGAGPFRQFRIVDHVSALAADASTLTADKAGAHGATTVAAATGTIPKCP